MVCSWLRPWPWLRLMCSVLSSRARAGRRNHQVPRVPLPDVGVTFIRETCTASSEDITPRSSLLRTHAPIPCGSPRLRLLASFVESSQVATSPCCYRDSPDVILRIFLQMPEPLPRRFAECVCLVLPQHSSAFPRDKSGRRPAVPREHDFPRICFRGCSYFFMFRPPRLLAPRSFPPLQNTAGRPRLLRPSRTCVVAFARIGYTIRLTTGNWRNEDFHLARFSALSAAPYLCKSVPGCLVPYPDGPTECTCLFLPRCHRPSQDTL
jgi:hypothetical protein